MSALPLLVLGIIILPTLWAFPEIGQEMVVTSTEAFIKKDEKEGRNAYSAPVPEIYEMRIRSDISNRFARTVIVSKARNFANAAKQVSFSILLPESAFISGFVMELEGKNYTAYVKEKEEAKRIYNQAVSRGVSAAHVTASARDSSRFTVSVNVKAEEKVAFYLTYEQLLVRRHNIYEQVINIHPGQPVKDLSVEIAISESRKITKLKAPPLRTGNEIEADRLELDPRADIEIINETAATVTFKPNVERQKELAHISGKKEENGLVGQFVVQYDVERDPQGGEVLVQDGYFVHYFAPTELQPLPKQVVFVLDTSGSMRGQKLKQLKEAMYKILDQLNEHDLFNLMEFNSNARVVDLDNSTNSVWYPHRNNKEPSSQTVPNLQDVTFPRAYPVNKANVENAVKAVSNLRIDGSTCMCEALKVGLRLVEIERVLPRDSLTRQPMIIFLTDGAPTDMNTSAIISQITEFNSELKRSAIFALAFGEGADKKFLQTLALRNFGYAKPIYVAADSSLQLQDFYREISSPLLSNVTFKYEPSVTSLTKTDFPIHFGGTEIAVAGFCGTELPLAVIDSTGAEGQIVLRPTITRTISNMERLWAYLTINQLLEKDDSSSKGKALALALKYSYVTPVSSMVVVKPNENSIVDSEQVRPAEHDIRPLHSPKSRMRNRARINSHSGIVVNDTLPVQSPKLEKLMGALPWLQVLVHNGFVNLPQGTYKLGLNETLNDIVTCPKTPLNLEGHCKLLHNCPKVYPLLQTSSNYLNHFCVLKQEFAGVCCPI